MVENTRVSSLSPMSENESSEHTPERFITHSSGSFIIGGERKEYAISHTTLSQTQPPTQLSSRRGYPISPPELINNVTLNSSKRPRGRPLGSKNKPKLPVVIREDDDTILEPILIEIPRGNDIVETLANLAQRRNTHITVSSGSGLVSDITLCHHVSPIKGKFYMTSISGTYINANCGHVPPQLITEFSIYLCGRRGQVFGGVVGGKVMSAGLVTLTANLFKKPKFHRLSIINGSFKEVEVDEPIYAANVITNADHTSIEPTTNSGNNNTATVVSDFSITGTNSMSVNHELPPPPPADVIMQWNHSTLADSY